MKHRKHHALLLLILGVLFAACQALEPGRTPFPCVLTTGEQDYGASLELHTEDPVSPGETIELLLLGGYYDVFPDCFRVAGEVEYFYPTAADLEDPQRTVAIFLDGMPLGSVECGYTCPIEVRLPQGIESGTYTITVIPDSWLYTERQVDLDIQIDT
jgi:hypothetical protein